jgi:hypothetical protein
MADTWRVKSEFLWSASNMVLRFVIGITSIEATDAIKNVLGFDKWVYARSKPDQQGWGAADCGEHRLPAGGYYRRLNYSNCCRQLLPILRKTFRISSMDNSFRVAGTWKGEQAANRRSYYDA